MQCGVSKAFCQDKIHGRDGFQPPPLLDPNFHYQTHFGNSITNWQINYESFDFSIESRFSNFISEICLATGSSVSPLVKEMAGRLQSLDSFASLRFLRFASLL